MPEELSITHLFLGEYPLISFLKIFYLYFTYIIIVLHKTIIN